MKYHQKDIEQLGYACMDAIASAQKPAKYCAIVQGIDFTDSNGQDYEVAFTVKKKTKND